MLDFSSRLGLFIKMMCDDNAIEFPGGGPQTTAGPPPSDGGIIFTCIYLDSIFLSSQKYPLLRYYIKMQSLHCTHALLQMLLAFTRRLLRP